MSKLFFGTGGVPHSAKPGSTVAGIRRIAELGLGCMEIEFVRGVKMSEDGAREVARTASDKGIKLSVHAPYYINLNAREPATLEASREREIKAQRQAAVGVLAAGMAHEINSPLNAVSLSLQSMTEKLPAETECGAELGTMSRALVRCKRIVTELLAFARNPRSDPDSRIEETVERSLTLFRREHPGVRVEREIRRDMPRLTIDRLQMQQAILNLLVNASDAMNGTGAVRVTLARENDRIALHVVDDGPGIKEEEVSRIFDPFYSSKPSGRGMGLGLPITAEIVGRNGGRIEVVRDGKGGHFVVSFPCEGARRPTGEG